MHKITIVGAGRVGESAAHNLAKAELARELVLVDIVEGMPQGTALDIQESAPIFNFDTKVTGANDLAAMAGSQLVIVTAGIPRKPGMSRSDILDVNLNVMHGIVDAMLKHAPKAMLLMVSNPVDVLTYAAWRRTGWPRQRVFGMAGVLDSARLASFVALETGFSVKDITAMVLGGHGDTMVPMTRFTCINGIPIEHFLPKAKIDAIVQRTRAGRRRDSEPAQNRERLRRPGGGHRHHGRRHQPQPPSDSAGRGGTRRRIRPARYRHGRAGGARRRRHGAHYRAAADTGRSRGVQKIFRHGARRFGTFES